MYTVTPVINRNVISIGQLDSAGIVSIDKVSMMSSDSFVYKGVNKAYFMDMSDVNDVKINEIECKLSGRKVLAHPHLPLACVVGVNHRLEVLRFRDGTFNDGLSVELNEEVKFWTWLTDQLVGIVTEYNVFHWDVFNRIPPVLVYKRHYSISNHQIVSYKRSPDGRFEVIVGLFVTHDGTGKHLGNIHLYSFEREVCQIISGYAADYYYFSLERNGPMCCYFSFFKNDGNLYLINLERNNKVNTQQSITFADDDDIPLSLHGCNGHGIIYLTTMKGYLFIFDMSTGVLLHMTQICKEGILCTSRDDTSQGIVFISKAGDVNLCHLNPNTFVPHILETVNSEIVFAFAIRASLPTKTTDMMKLDLLSKIMDKGFKNTSLSTLDNTINVSSWLLKCRCPALYRNQDYLNNVSTKISKYIINYLYFDDLERNIRPSVEELFLVWQHSLNLGLWHLAYIVKCFLREIMTVDNVLEMMEHSFEKNLRDELSTFFSFIQSNFHSSSLYAQLSNGQYSIQASQFLENAPSVSILEIVESTFNDDFDLVFDQMLFTDISFVVRDKKGEEKEFYLHHSIVSVNSSYLNMLLGREQLDQFVHITVLPLATFEAMIDYFYLRIRKFTPTNAIHFFCSGNMYLCNMELLKMVDDVIKSIVEITPETKFTLQNLRDEDIEFLLEEDKNPALKESLQLELSNREFYNSIYAAMPYNDLKEGMESNRERTEEIYTVVKGLEEKVNILESKLDKIIEIISKT